MANYSSKRTCSYCRQTGHNRRTCPDLAKSSYGQRVQQRSRESASNRRCGFCQQKGHTQRTCSVKTKIVDEASARVSDVRAVWSEKRRQLGMGEHSMIKVYPIASENRYHMNQWSDDLGKDGAVVLMVGIDDGYLLSQNTESASDRSNVANIRQTLNINCYRPQSISDATRAKQGRVMWYRVSGHVEIQLSLPGFKQVKEEWDLAGEWKESTWIVGGYGAGGGYGVTEDDMLQEAEKLIAKSEEKEGVKAFQDNAEKFREYCKNNPSNMTLGYVAGTICLIEVVSPTKVSEDCSNQETWTEWYNQYTRNKDNYYRDFKNLVTNRSYEEARKDDYRNTYWLDELKSRFGYGAEG